MEPLISVVIPIKDGDFWIEDLVKKLLSQTLADKTEVILVDSGSTDKTLDILAKYPVRVIHVQPQDFNHGETRNVGVRAAKGKYVVLTVQDALPQNDLWLQTLLDGFIDDEVVAVCGQQIVGHDLDKNPLKWFRPINKPTFKRVQFKNGEYDLLSPAEKKNAAGWDDVTSCYRKDIMDQMPFQRTSFAEDCIWANEALKKGFALVYNYNARVYHYHHDEPFFAFKRCLIEWSVLYNIFKSVPKDPRLSLRQKLGVIKLLMTTKGLSFSKKIFWIKFNLKRQNAIDNAYKTFMEAYHKGEAGLAELFRIHCSAIPVAKKWEV
ncbi:MAG: glycosyltransferase family 2 protein [Bacteroidota bacterium]